MTEGSSSPIGEVDTIDIVGVRKDGGLDLAICANAALDHSSSTLSRLETKIRNYLTAAQSEEFLSDYGCSAGVPVTVYIFCEYPIVKEARDLIERLRTTAHEQGIGLEVRANAEEV